MCFFIQVSLARPSNETIKGANLYVSGLPRSLTQPEMEKIFTPFGNIITSRILSDNVTGLSKGMFLSFNECFLPTIKQITSFRTFPRTLS